MYSLETAVKAAKEYLGEQYFVSLNISLKKINDINGLEISKNDKDVVIKYGQLASLFYSLTLIKQNYKKDNYHISLKRHFDSNGLMKDCSRNGPLNIRQAKEIIMVLSLFGLNRFMLYTEEVYEIKDEPYFGYLRGRYTKEELTDLVDYASSFGVQIIPCIQTLSHLNQMLRWSEYDGVKDTINTLNLLNPKSLQLIDKMICTCKEIFNGEEIHIGLDEAIDLGVGPFAFNDIIIDKKKMFMDHLNAVVQICRKYELKPMMWGDMFFKLNADNSNGHKDWTTTKDHLSDDIKKLIPDISLIYWDYYHDEQEVYDRMISHFVDTGKHVIFAGGALTWSGFVPNIIQSMEHSRCGLNSSIKHHVKDVMACSWGDNGNECSVIPVYATLALHSVYEWYGKGSNKEVSKILKTVTGESLKSLGLLQEINHIRKDQIAFENYSKPIFYQDILLGIFDKKVKLEHSLHFANISKKIKKEIKKSAKYGYIYENLYNFSSFLIEKSTIGIKLRKAYKDRDSISLKNNIYDLEVMLKKLNKFKQSFYFQWHKENKPFGYEVIDGRLGFLESRIKTAIETVQDYLNNKVDVIPQLEIEILPWQNQDVDDPLYVAKWSDIVSGNCVD